MLTAVDTYMGDGDWWIDAGLYCRRAIQLFFLYLSIHTTVQY